MDGYQYIYCLPQAGGRIRSQGNYCLPPAGGLHSQNKVIKCVGLGPVLASHDPSQPAAASAVWRGLGLVPIAGWSYGGVGPQRGLRRGGRRGWCEEWARRG
jgi:hypothetical protein